MDLNHYLKIALRWWWLILLSVAITATTSYVYSQRLPKIYSATATLSVGTEITESKKLDSNELNLSRSLAFVYSELVSRRPITQGVVDRLGLEMSPDQLGGMIKTRVIPSAQLLEIAVMDVNPRRAQLLANAIAEELILQSPTGSGEQQERESFIRAQLAELQAKIQATDGKITELEDSLAAMTSAVEIAEAQSQLVELEKLKGSYQSNYTQYLSNLSEYSPNRLTIFEPAIEPIKPVSPNVKMNVLVAALAGLALAVSAIAFLEFFDDVLAWQPEASGTILGLPVLGAIGKASHSSSRILAQDEPWSLEAEDLRNLRSNLFLMAEDGRLATLLITSTMPGDGKSFLAANLAATAASPGGDVIDMLGASGASVILVDADLRKPSLHELFDMPNLSGMTDVLAAREVPVETMLDKALRPTGVSNLYLLPAGRTPADPGQLLNSSRLAQVLRALNARADLVIIDSAPILAAVDTQFLANLVDAAVLVVNDGKTRRRLVKKAKDYFLGKEESNLLGLVFNRVKSKGSHYYYRYYHYAGHRGGRPRQAEALKRQPTLLSKIWPFTRYDLADDAALTLAEAADYLGVSEETARRWCKEGRLQAVKKGRRWLVRQEDLNQFVAAYRGNGAGSAMGLPEDNLVVMDSHSASQ